MSRLAQAGDSSTVSPARAAGLLLSRPQDPRQGLVGDARHRGLRLHRHVLDAVSGADARADLVGRAMRLIADGIVDTLRAEGVRPIGREGDAASHWILVDFGSVIVHVFTPPERDYYELEKYWSEARTILRVQ